jgi:hypothetical protein
MTLSQTQAEFLYHKLQSVCGLKKGSIAIIKHSVRRRELGWNNSWDTYMSNFIGCEFEVVDINEHGIKLYSTGYRYPFYVLESPDLDVEAIKKETIKVLTLFKESL